jgi:hypothetical protein
MVQASLFEVVSLVVVPLVVVPFVVVPLVVVPLVVVPLGAATGFAIWLETFVEVQENKDENIVYVFVDTCTIHSGVYYIHFYSSR